MERPIQSGPLAQPTRARLFAAVQALDRAASTEELATELGMHVNGVRRHLELMHDSGLLERHRIRHGRGRPRDGWSVVPEAIVPAPAPESYEDVATWLARAIPPGPAGLRRVERTGREVGRELAVGNPKDLVDGLEKTMTALGFQPSVVVGGDAIVCVLTNCPYRASVRQNPDAVCTLHQGITAGLLDQLDPEARLKRFEPHDPDEAGCVIEVSVSPAP